MISDDLRARNDAVGDVLGSRRYWIGTTVHGALDDSALNSGGQVVTAHAGAPGMLSPQFPVPERSRHALHGAPFLSMFPVNVLPNPCATPSRYV